MSNIDLNEIANNQNLKLQISSCHEEHPADAILRRIKDGTLFAMAAIFISSVFVYCGYSLSKYREHCR